MSNKLEVKIFNDQESHDSTVGEILGFLRKHPEFTAEVLSDLRRYLVIKLESIKPFDVLAVFSVNPILYELVHGKD